MARPGTSEPGDFDPVTPVAERAQPAATGSAHVGPRTYVSKIENEKATRPFPHWNGCTRARSHCTRLAFGGERNRQEKIGELMKISLSRN